MTRSDAIVRRQLLKAGLIVAGAPFCPEALFDRRAAADDEKPAEDTPIGPREIVKGLDGMSRVADKGNTFGRRAQRRRRHLLRVLLPRTEARRRHAERDSGLPRRPAVEEPDLRGGPAEGGRRPEAHRGSARRPRRRHRHTAWERPQHHLRGHLPQGPPRGARGRDARADRRAAEDGPELREDEGARPRRIPTRSWASTTSRSSSTSFSRSS